VAESRDLDAIVATIEERLADKQRPLFPCGMNARKKKASR